MFVSGIWTKRECLTSLPFSKTSFTRSFIIKTMPYCEVGSRQNATGDANLNNGIKIFYRTYGQGPTKVLLIIGRLSRFNIFLYNIFFWYFTNWVLVGVFWVVDKFAMDCQVWRGLTIHGAHKSRGWQGPLRPMMMLKGGPPMAVTMRLVLVAVASRSVPSITVVWVGAPCPPKNPNIREFHYFINLKKSILF